MDINLNLNQLTVIANPCPKPLVPQPPKPNANPVQPNSKPELVPRGLGLTLKSCRPLPSPIFVERSTPDQIERSMKLRERLSQPLIDKKN